MKQALIFILDILYFFAQTTNLSANLLIYRQVSLYFSLPEFLKYLRDATKVLGMLYSPVSQDRHPWSDCWLFEHTSLKKESSSATVIQG